jgi:hypothetical protein
LFRIGFHHFAVLSDLNRQVQQCDDYTDRTSDFSNRAYCVPVHSFSLNYVSLLTYKTTANARKGEKG